MIFDTHRVVKKFVSVGFTEEQAEVFAEEQKIIIENNLATKQDVAEIHFKIESLRKDMETLRQEIKKDMGTLRQEIKKDMGTLRQETKKDIELSTKKMYIVLFSSIFTSIGFFVTVLKVLQLLKL